MATTTNNRWFILIGAVVITANIITLSLLWMRHGGADHRQPHGGGGPFEFLSNELQLTSAQKASYAALRDAHHAAASGLQDSLKNAKDDFFDLLKNDTASAQTVETYSARAAGISQRIDTLTFYHFKKLRAICTPVQKQKFDEIIREAIRGVAAPGPPDRRPPPPDHP